MLPHYWCILCKGFSRGWSLPAFLLWMKSGIPEPLCEISAHVNQTTPGWRFCALWSLLNGSHTAMGNGPGKEMQLCMRARVSIGTFTHTKPKWKQNTNGLSLILLFLFKSQDQAAVDTNLIWRYYKSLMYTNGRVSLWFEKQTLAAGPRPKPLSPSVWVL